MHHPRQAPRGFDAQLQVQVPRNGGGTLEDGLRNMVEAVDYVATVETVDLKGLVPRLNDLAVEATVTGRVADAGETEVDEDELAAALADTFGIATVEQCGLGPRADDGQTSRADERQTGLPGEEGTARTAERENGRADGKETAPLEYG